jgi:outer membrane protein assembly factor BamB
VRPGVRQLAILAVVALAACSPGSGGKGTSPSAPARPSSSTPARAGGSEAWTTYLRDLGRSGVASDGPAEPGSARRLWSSPALDGDLYAQPLIVRGRVIVATENDTVYALDASSGAVVWQTHVGDPVAGDSLPCGNVDPVGMTGTPVVDVEARRVYAAGMVRPGRHELFALDLRTGKVVASAVVDAPGADPAVHNQRGALSLSNGKVLVPFGGRFGDCGDYHGRLVAVPVTASGLGSPAAYSLPTEREGGFWTPPGATVDRAGNVFLASGNSSSGDRYDYGNSVIRLGPDLRLADSFAPADWQSLNAADADLGSTGPVLLPNGRVFQVGKAGVGYLLDASHLGGIGGQLHDGRVCDGPAFGASAHSGITIFVPCIGAVVAVTAGADGFEKAWTAEASTPGPTVVTTGAVWTVATGSGDLLALNPQTGDKLFSTQIGSVPSRFTSLAAGGGRVVVGANRTMLAFGN